MTAQEIYDTVLRPLPLTERRELKDLLEKSLTELPPPAEQTTPTPEELGYPADFFEKIIGKWEGDFERPSQGEYEERLPME